MNHSRVAAVLLLCAEELRSHTATSHLSFSQVRRLLCKQDLAHESPFGLLFSRKINYQSKLPFLCDSKAIRKAPWMPFLPEQEKEKNYSSIIALCHPSLFIKFSSSKVQRARRPWPSAAMVCIYCQSLFNTDDYLRKDKTIMLNNKQYIG